MKKIILVLIVILLTGCSSDSGAIDNTNSVSEKQCLSGEYEVSGRCCRYISRYPNKDGSCPVGYDDSAPGAYNPNMCYKESCRVK